ncbi:S8 family serine peptidase [Pseudidiomarina sp. PP-1MA]|uniref:S8 family serine peptidase n=1 Tax=Pseudidiomarina sp. PP-1MA TaxID=3237706 RepID=A0AB39XAS8_9GAMM
MSRTLHTRWSAIALAVATATGLGVATAQDVQSLAVDLQPHEEALKVEKRARQTSIISSQNKRASTRYLIEFEDAPVATYKGGVAGFAATSAVATGAATLSMKTKPVQDYQSYLVQRQNQMLSQMSARAPGLKAKKNLTVTLNGMIVDYAGGDLAAQLRGMPGVKAVHRDTEMRLKTDVSPALINADDVWGMLGGQDRAGEGINIAIIDSGIDSSHPIFADNGHSRPEGLPTDDYCAVTDPTFCNDKVVLARVYDPFDPEDISEDEILDSPQDTDGHGSHVAGTAAGNPLSINLNGLAVNVTGIAPGANIMAYKALFTTLDGVGSGSSLSLAAALEDAAADGADVINNSWGGGAGGNPANSAYRTIMTSLQEMGVVTVTAAGNDGPGPNTIGCPGCVEDTISVASTQHGRQFGNNIELEGFYPITALPGNYDNEYTLDEPVTGEWLPVSQISETNLLACAPYEAGSLEGAIAMVPRGECSFAEKAASVQAAGAVGMIVYNNAAGTISMNMADATLPAVSITQAIGEQLETLYEPGLTVSLNPFEAWVVPANVDAVSGFSSRGPNGDSNVLKPDLAAPGSSILSSLPGGEFNLLSGTSMASPHVAGAAALLLANNPELTPAQVKSVLMTSGVRAVTKEDTQTAADPFDIGGGRIDVLNATRVAVALDTASIANNFCEDVCSFTRQITSLVGEETVWNVSASFNDSAVTATFPETVTIAGGGAAELGVEIDISASAGGWQFGTLTLTHNAGDYAPVNVPIAVFAEEMAPVGSIGGSIGDADTGTTNTPLNFSMTGRLGTLEGANVTLSAQLPVEGVTIDEATLVETEVGSVASEKGLNTETNTYTWTGVQTNAPAELDLALLGGGIAGATLDQLGVTSYQTFCNEAPGCDETRVNIPLGDFSYVFDGVEYNNIVMWSNGIIEIGESRVDSTYQLSFIPDPTAPNGVLAPFWADMVVNQNVNVGGEMRIAVVNAGAPYLVMEWVNVSEYDEPGSTYTFSAWVALDDSADVMFNYVDVNAQAPAAALAGGVETMDGTGGGFIYVGGTDIGGDLAGSMPQDGWLVQANLVPGEAAEVSASFDFSVSNFGAVGAGEASGLHSRAITVDLTEAVGTPSREVVAMLAASTDEGEVTDMVPVTISPDGALTVEIVDQPANGTVELDGMTATYTPAAGFVGDDSFTYRAVDESGAVSDAGTVTVAVTNTNPTATVTGVTDPKAEGDEITLSVSASDADGDSLTYQWEVISGPAVTLGSATGSSVTFTAPYVETEQTLQLQVTVSDGAGSVVRPTSVKIVPPKSSSAFGWWLTLLALPLVWARRRTS